jgi:hypothetical protein
MVTKSSITKRAKKKVTKTKKKKQHITLQDLLRGGPNSPAFHSTPECTLSASNAASTAKRVKKTPRENAKKCIGKVRIGQDGKFVYIAMVKRQKNPKYKTSSTPSTGTHIVAKWEKLYDSRTNKPLEVSNLSNKNKLKIL